MLSPTLRGGLDRNWLRASILGGALFCVHQVLYFTSLKLTTVANVTIIGALQPVLVLLLAGRMFGEAVTTASVVWSIVAFVGTAMVVLGSSAAPTWSLLGDTLATMNLFAFTAYFLASKRIRATVGAWEYVVGMTTVSGFGMALAAVATGQDFGSPRGADWLLLATPTSIGVDGGDCTLAETRACYLDPLVTVGRPHPVVPVGAAGFCTPATSSSGVNNGVGLPGPTRWEQEALLTLFCANAPLATYTPGTGGCP